MSTLTGNIQSDLRKSDEHFENGFGTNNPQIIAGCYTQDAMLLPAKTSFIKGQAAIQSFWQSVLKSGIDEVKLNILEIEEHDQTAISVGEYVLASKGQTADQGKYIVIWKLQNGEWKMHRDIWTTSLTGS